MPRALLKILPVLFLAFSLAVTTAYVANPDLKQTFESWAKDKKDKAEKTRAQKNADRKIKLREQQTGCQGAACLAPELVELKTKDQEYFATVSETEKQIVATVEQAAGGNTQALNELKTINPFMAKQLEEQQKTAVAQPVEPTTPKAAADEAATVRAERKEAQLDPTTVADNTLTGPITPAPAPLPATSPAPKTTTTTLDTSITDAQKRLAALRAKDVREAQQAAITATDEETRNKALQEIAELAQPKTSAAKPAINLEKYQQIVTQACGNLCVVNQKNEIQYVAVGVSSAKTENIGVNSIVGQSDYSPFDAAPTEVPCGGLGSAGCNSGPKACNTGLIVDNRGVCRRDPNYDNAQALATVIQRETAANQGTIQPEVLTALIANNSQAAGQLSQFKEDFCPGGNGACVYSDKEQKFTTVSEANPNFNYGYWNLVVDNPTTTVNIDTGNLNQKCRKRYLTSFKGSLCNNDLLACTGDGTCELTEPAKDLIAAKTACAGSDCLNLNLASFTAPGASLAQDENLAAAGCGQSKTVYQANGSAWICWDADSKIISRAPSLDYAINPSLAAGIFAGITDSAAPTITLSTDTNGNQVEVETCPKNLIKVNHSCVDPKVAAFDDDYNAGAIASSMRDNLFNDVPLVDWTIDHIVAPMVAAFSPSYYGSAKAQAEIAQEILKNRPEDVSVDQVLATINPNGRAYAHILTADKFKGAEFGLYKTLAGISLFTSAWTEDSAAAIGQVTGYTQDQAFLNYAATYADPNTTAAQKAGSAALFGGEIALTAADVGGFALAPFEKSLTAATAKLPGLAAVRAVDQKVGTIIALPLVAIGRAKYPATVLAGGLTDFVAKTWDNFFSGGGKAAVEEVAEETAEKGFKELTQQSVEESAEKATRETGQEVAELPNQALPPAVTGQKSWWQKLQDRLVGKVDNDLTRGAETIAKENNYKFLEINKKDLTERIDLDQGEVIGTQGEVYKTTVKVGGQNKPAAVKIYFTQNEYSEDLLKMLKEEANNTQIARQILGDQSVEFYGIVRTSDGRIGIAVELLEDSKTVTQKTIDDLLNIQHKLHQAGYYDRDFQFMTKADGSVTILDLWQLKRLDDPELIKSLAKDFNLPEAEIQKDILGYAAKNNTNPARIRIFGPEINARTMANRNGLQVNSTLINDKLTPWFDDYYAKLPPPAAPVAKAGQAAAPKLADRAKNWWQRNIHSSENRWFPSLTKDPGAKIAKDITGLDIGDIKLPVKLRNDHLALKAKYNLPPREMRFNNPQEYINSLKQVARDNNIPIRDISETEELFFQGRKVTAHFDDKSDQLFVDFAKENTDPIAFAGDLEHELIHGIQNKYNPSMAIELREYETYVTANMQIGGDWLDWPNNQEQVFGYIKGSVDHWYAEMGLTNPWQNVTNNLKKWLLWIGGGTGFLGLGAIGGWLSGLGGGQPATTTTPTATQQVETVTPAPPTLTITPTNTAIPPTATPTEIAALPVSQKPGSLTLDTASNDQERIITYLALLVNSYTGPASDPDAFAAYIRTNLSQSEFAYLLTLPKGANNHFSENFAYYETSAIRPTFYSVPGERFQCGDFAQLLEIVPGLNPPHISGYSITADETSLVNDVLGEVNQDKSAANTGRLDALADLIPNRPYNMGEHDVYRFSDLNSLNPGDALINSNDKIDHIRTLISKYDSPQGLIFVFAEANSPVDGEGGLAQVYAIRAEDLYRQIGIGSNNQQALENTLVMRLKINETLTGQPIPDAPPEILELLNP